MQDCPLRALSICERPLSSTMALHGGIEIIHRILDKPARLIVSNYRDSTRDTCLKK